MPGAIEQTLWRKIRYTPMRDLLRGRMTGRLDVGRAFESTMLPAPVKDLVGRVVRSTRLWRLERVEVLAELSAHFNDGIASGVPIETLIEKFGDEKQAAKLIRRAKRRNRGLPWQAARIAGWSTVACLAFYVGFAVYFYAGRPSPTINYVARVNETIEKTPVESRAWPLYRRALIGVRHISREAPDGRYPPRARERLLQLVGERQAEIEWIRQGVARPAFGFLIGPRGSANDPELWTPREPAPGERPLDEDLNGAMLPPLPSLLLLGELLAADAELARRARDGNRTREDIQSILALSRQLGDNAGLLCSLVALIIDEIALDEIERTLVADPALLSREDWARLAQQLSTAKVAADVVPLEPERLAFEDMLQRAFTDDGTGDGRLTPEGVRYFLAIMGIRAAWMGAVEPAAGLLTGSRQRLRREFSQMLDRAAANYRRPMRDADWRYRETEWNLSALRVIRVVSADWFVQEYWRIQVRAERYLGRRDGIVAAIAAEIFRQDKGEYPEQLTALVPQYLPKAPADRINGEPLHYKLAGSRPMIYSVGADRKDDGGRTAATQALAAAIWETTHSPMPDGDWLLYPTVP